MKLSNKLYLAAFVVVCGSTLASSVALSTPALGESTAQNESHDNLHKHTQGTDQAIMESVKTPTSKEVKVAADIEACNKNRSSSGTWKLFERIWRHVTLSQESGKCDVD